MFNIIVIIIIIIIVFFFENADSTHNFKKFDFIDSMGVSYDYGSIMHYGKHDFAKLPWQVTIRPKKPGVEIGQLKHLSPLDVKTG